MSTHRAAVVQVFIFKAGQFLGVDVFAEPRFTIGRDETAVDLLLESEKVSRCHAVVEHDGEHLRIRDNGSTNGVYINDARVESGEIGRLDQVAIGDYTLKLKLLQPRVVGAGVDEVVEPTRIERGAAGSAPLVASAAVASRQPVQRAKSIASAPADPEPEPAADNEPTRTDVVVGAPAPLVAAAVAAPARGRRERAPAAPAAPAVPAVPAVPAAPPRAAPRSAPVEWDDNEDEEDLELDKRASFSLAANLLAAPTEKLDDEPTHVEVVAVREGLVIDVAQIARGEAYHLGYASRRARQLGLRPRVRLLSVRPDGRCLLEPTPEMTGTVRRQGSSAPLEQAVEVGRKGRRSLVLDKGDEARLTSAATRYRVRFACPPQLAADERSLRERLRPDRLVGRSFLGSAGGHLFVVLVGIFLPAQPVAPPAATESFAEVTLDREVKLEEPVAAPPKVVEPTPKATAQQPVAKTMEAAANKHPKAGGTAKAPPGVLGLLSKRGSSAAPGPAAALAAVSNLSAASAPAGASGFRVSGLVGKLATSDIMIGGGGGGLVTKGGTALLRGGGGGAGALAGGGNRQVGGIVQKVPQEMHSVGQGSLDRDAIQKVINANVGQIQRCYERELVQNPGLSGKIEVEWVVGTSGAVRSTRQKFATLGSSAAIACILEKIRGWRFPQPKGGEVIVSYPFVFKSIGY